MHHRFLNSPSREFNAISDQRLRKQSLRSCRRARRAGGPICTLGFGKSTFDCGLVRTSSLDRSTQRTQLPQNGTFLLVRRATGRVPDAGNHVNRWFFAGRTGVVFPPQEFDDGSTWATCQLITLPWSWTILFSCMPSYRQPKSRGCRGQVFRKTSAGADFSRKNFRSLTLAAKHIFRSANAIFIPKKFPLRKIPKKKIR